MSTNPKVLSPVTSRVPDKARLVASRALKVVVPETLRLVAEAASNLLLPAETFRSPDVNVRSPDVNVRSPVPTLIAPDSTDKLPVPKARLPVLISTLPPEIVRPLVADNDTAETAPVDTRLLNLTSLVLFKD